MAALMEPRTKCQAVDFISSQSISQQKRNTLTGFTSLGRLLHRARSRFSHPQQSGRVPPEIRVQKLILWALRSLNNSQSCVHVVGPKWFWFTVLDSSRAAPCLRSGSGFHGSGGAVGGRRASGLGTSGLHLCFLQMMWFCWLLPAVTFSVYWSGPQWRVGARGLGLRQQ